MRDSVNLIEKVFVYKKTKHELSPPLFNRYIRYYFEEDVVRSGLIMALHHLKTIGIPRLPKLKFSEFPIATLLVISDELQEFIRRGRDGSEQGILIKLLPRVNTKAVDGVVKIEVCYRHDSQEIVSIKEKVKEKKSTEAIGKFWQAAAKAIESRLEKDRRRIELKFCAFERGQRKPAYEWIY